MLDRFEADHPERRVVRLRPGVVLQEAAASELARYFLGPFVPQSLVRRALLPVIPAVDRLAVQVVHAEDMARAYVLACTTPVTGAFNIAAEPVLDPPTIAAVLGARHRARSRRRCCAASSRRRGGCTCSRPTRAGSTSAAARP